MVSRSTPPASGFQRIKEVCLYIEDLESAKAFYHQKLGLPVIGSRAGNHVFFRVGDTVLLCFNPQSTRQQSDIPPHYGGGKQHLAFECSPGDYHDWKKFILDQGIAITHEQQWGEGILSFYFEDPAGNVLEVVQTGMWGE